MGKADPSHEHLHAVQFRAASVFRIETARARSSWRVGDTAAKMTVG